MKRFFSLLQSKSWTSLFAPAIATVGVGGLIFSGSHIKNIPGKPFNKEQLKNCTIHQRNFVSVKFILFLKNKYRFDSYRNKFIRYISLFPKVRKTGSCPDGRTSST